MLGFIAKLYGKVADVRNRLYDQGVFHSERLPARTISIGNITAGGTGKTPLVAYVADVLAARGEKVCILTRGYGRRDESMRVLVSDRERVLEGPDAAGDEPVELARHLLGKAVVIADADRISSAEWAGRRFKPTVFILDDGFQHRRAARHLDIVCIDATDPFGGEQMLPAGRLREPLHNLARADVVVITRSNLRPNVSQTKRRIAELAPDAKIFEAARHETGCEAARGHAAYAFCGIGNPDAFFEQLRGEALSLAGTRSFRDHWSYQRSDIAAVEEAARQVHADLLVTTRKDAVKLDPAWFTMPYHVLGLEIVLDDPTGFAALL
jgi:tetraacyldisaccharide 4'-kinase